MNGHAVQHAAGPGPRLLAQSERRIVMTLFRSTFESIHVEENRRRAYLKAMGIDCFVAPAGGASPVTGATEISAPGARPNAIPRPATARTLRPAPAPPGNSPATRAAPVATAAATETAESFVGDLRFTLQFFRFGKRLAVLNELPYLAANGSRPDEVQLLDRILNALGKPPARAAGEPELVFSWPLSDNAPVTADSSQDARHLLHGMLQGRQARGHFDKLLVMAGRCESLLLPPGSRATDGPLQLPALGCEAIFTHSLGAMISVPALKRPVWQAIQPLVGILSESEDSQSD